MLGISGPVSAMNARDARRGVRVAWRGLARVLAGSDPALGWRWRSPRQRRLCYGAFGAAALLLCAGSLASMADGHAIQFRSGPPYKVVTSAMFRTQFPPVFGVPVLGGAATLGVLAALLTVAVPLALAPRYPLLGWRIGWLGLLLVPALEVRWWGGLPWDPVQLLVLLVVLWAAGIRHERPVLGWLWALTLVPWWFWAGQNGLSVVTAAFGTIAFLAMAVAVDGVSSRQRAQRALTDQAERTELERARRAVLEERARIARELHDVVAHHMSLIAVRAETAPYRLAGAGLPEPARTEFGLLSHEAREALADMRRLLGVLRSDQPAARAPQPELADLPELIDSLRRAGMAVELSVPPTLARVPSHAGVCAYRIVQEALSNAGRHAAGAPVAVSVNHDAEAVMLEVANGPGATVPLNTGPNEHGPGHGLTGMRERAELLGGSLLAGSLPGGGFVVSAVLPLGGPGG